MKPSFQAAEKLVKRREFVGDDNKVAGSDGDFNNSAGFDGGNSTTATPLAPVTPIVTSATTPQTSMAIVPETKESEIPLFLDNKKSEHGLGSVAWRLIASLALIALWWVPGWSLPVNAGRARATRVATKRALK